MAIWRVRTQGQVRLARGPAETGPVEFLDPGVTLDGLLGGPPGAFTAAAVDGPGAGPVGHAVPLVPLEAQEVWAAGVTYQRSLDARRHESASPDHYDLVYVGERPELFVKALPGRTRGPNSPIGIRSDSSWDVPEPELGVLVDRHGTIVAYTVGNDVSSRSIEGENPLYLTQAKIYNGSCAVGPCLVPLAEAPDPSEMTITLRVDRAESPVYEDSIEVRKMRRTVSELVEWLCRGQDLPVGALLLTGTAIVPDERFTLLEGDRVSIAITGLGELVNTVKTVDVQPVVAAVEEIDSEY